jgi:3-oxoadipate enol-lactonase
VPAEARPIWQERIATAETQGMEPLVEPTIGRWFTAPFREQRQDVVDPVRTRIRTTNPRGYAGCCHAISELDLTDKLSAIKLPTLIVVGEEDQGTPVAASQAIQAKIAGSQLEIIKSAAHLSNLEQPEAFTRIVTSFLSRVG